MIQLEPQAWWVYLLGLLALIATVVSYRNHPMMDELNDKRKNTLLFIRIAGILVLFFILLNPVLVQEKVEQKSPSIVLAIDNSQSVDNQDFNKSNLSGFINESKDEENDLNIFRWSFSDEVNILEDSIAFNGLHTNAESFIQKVSSSYSADPTFKGLVLLSDGQFNRGGNPLLNADKLPFPIYSVGIGNPPEGTDALLNNIRFNRKVELGNRLEIEGIVRVQRGNRQRVRLNLTDERGSTIDQKTFSSSKDDQSFRFSFYPEAGMEIGRRNLKLELTLDEEDINLRNNVAAISFEVVEKEAIISLIYDRIHPDLGALARSLTDYDAYQVEYVDVSKDERPDDKSRLFIVVHPGREAIRKVNSWIRDSKVSIWWLAGYAESAISLSNFPVEIGFQKQEGNDDEVFAALDPRFSAFQLSEESSLELGKDAPLSSPYGKWFYGAEVNIQMYQKIGSLVTEKPLMFSSEDRDGRQWAVTTGRGLWRWRMQEYRRTKATGAFDEWVSSWVRYLQSRQDNNRLSVEAAEEIALGDLWKAQVRLKDASGAWSQRAIVNLEIDLGKGEKFEQQGSAKGAWKQLSFKPISAGDYDYTISASLGNETFSQSGRIRVGENSLESLSTGADTATLAELSRLTGGKYYPLSPGVLENIKSEIDLRPIVSVSKEVQDLINYKVLFFVLLFLFSLEWILRRYFGLY